jgi:hypothetical protein
MTVMERPAEAVPSTGWGLRPVTAEADGSMAREVVQSFYLMGFLAVSLSFFLGLGFLAMWLLG